MDDPLVLCERRVAVAVVTLNREEKRNAVNGAMSRQLSATLRELDEDGDIRAIVITGAGQIAFCAGADMNERDRGLTEPRERSPSEGSSSSGISAVAEVQKPVIAAINGFAYGGGARLALGADIRLGSPNAKFRFVGASYGIVTCAALLPALVGPAHAAELVFSARPVDAQEALALGLLNRIVPAGELVEESVKLAQQIAENSPAAVLAAKEVIRQAAFDPDAMRMEAEANSGLSRSSEHRARFGEATRRIVGS
jgi:enoyl-CoA hydratase